MELPLEPSEDPAKPGMQAVELVDGEPDPLARLTERERTETLHVAMTRLSPQRRRCCQLRYVDRLKYREIASVMAISIETVKAHLHQARGCIVDAVQGPGRSGTGGRSVEDSRSS
jgi:RNA polymerase sigma factor (sigma-70 family)